MRLLHPATLGEPALEVHSAGPREPGRSKEALIVSDHLPFKFDLMVCFLLFKSAEEPDRVRTLLEDVENVRRAKMYEGMGSAAQEVQQAVKVRTYVTS